MTADVGGTTASNVDLAANISSKLPLQIIVVIGSASCCCCWRSARS